MMRRAVVVVSLLVPFVAMAQPAPAPEPSPAPEPAPVPESPPEPDPNASAATMPPEPEKTVSAPVPAPEPGAPVDPADAPPPAGWRLMLSDLTVLRLNPLGLETRARFGMQKRLFASDKAITKNNFMFLGTFPKLNPASAHISLGGEIQPASIFNLRAFGELQQYFGTFGYLQSFTSPTANYSDETLKDLRDDPVRQPQSTRMFHVSIQPLFQVKAGPIAVRALFQFDYWDFKVRQGDTVAYEATFDTLLPDKGWTLSTDTDVLYTGKKRLAIGLRHSLVKPFYKQRHFADPAVDNGAAAAAYDGENSHQRIGLFGAYTFHDRGPSKFNKPTVVLIVSWYLDHRWRVGEPSMLPAGGRADDYTSRAFPYFLLGYAFESDLLSVK